MDKHIDGPRHSVGLHAPAGAVQYVRAQHRGRDVAVAERLHDGADALCGRDPGSWLGALQDAAFVNGKTTSLAVVGGWNRSRAASRGHALAPAQSRAARL